MLTLAECRMQMHFSVLVDMEQPEVADSRKEEKEEELLKWNRTRTRTNGEEAGSLGGLVGTTYCLIA